MSSERLIISGPGFALIVKSVLEKGVSAKFKVRGKSMFPNILDHDVVTISPYVDKKPEPGDVVALMEQKYNRMIIHRIIKRRDDLFIIKGDSMLEYDGQFPRQCIAGFVSRVERKHNLVSTCRIKKAGYIIMSKLRIFWLIRILFGFK